MAITLTTEFADLQAQCAEAQAAASDRGDVEVSVRFADDGDPVPNHGALGASPAFLRRSTNTILVKRRAFLDLTQDEQVAVLLHEVAHAIEAPGLETGVAELLADRFVQSVGHGEALARNRTSHFGPIYGPAYVALLQLRSDEDALEALKKWRYQRMANIAPT